MNFEKAAGTYCEFRQITGAIVSGVIGVIMMFVSIFATRIVGDTSSYLPIDATVTSATMSTTTTGGKYPRTSFVAKYFVTYAVNGKKYPGNVTESFATFDAAKLAIDSSKDAIKKIYYDPLDPTKNASSKSAESVLRWASFGVAVLCFAFAIISYLFRKNLVFCAVTTLDNLSSFSY